MKLQVLLLAPVGLLTLVVLSGCAPRSARPLFDIAKDGSPAEMKAALVRPGAGAGVREAGQGKTVLMWAAQFNSNPRTVQAILDAGGNVSDRDNRGPSSYGWTALMWAAASSKSPDVVTVLIKAGSDIKATDKDGLTPLMIAAGNNETAAVVERIAGAGSDLEAKDTDGYTALMYAASKSHNPDVVATLLKIGANAKVKNSKGYSVLDYAKANRALKDTDSMRELEKASQ